MFDAIAPATPAKKARIELNKATSSAKTSGTEGSNDMADMEDPSEEEATN